MPRVGHGPATEERRLNCGLQTLPSGISAFPVARHSVSWQSGTLVGTVGSRIGVPNTPGPQALSPKP